MEASPDAALVARCRAGEAAAWRELVERYARYVTAIAMAVYRLPEPDAEDVFQDVFARVYERLDTLRDDDALRPWIAQTTRRCCVDRLRAGAREVAVAEPDDQAADDEISRLDEAMAVQAALDGLSDDCREVLDRFFCRDESYRTIGEALSIPAGTIASRIARCLARLRERLTGRFSDSGPSGGRMGDRP